MICMYKVCSYCFYFYFIMSRGSRLKIYTSRLQYFVSNTFSLLAHIAHCLRDSFIYSITSIEASLAVWINAVALQISLQVEKSRVTWNRWCSMYYSNTQGGGPQRHMFPRLFKMHSVTSFFNLQLDLPICTYINVFVSPYGVFQNMYIYIKYR